MYDILNCLLYVRCAQIWYDLAAIKEFVIHEVRCMAHQKLATIVDHACNLRPLLIRNGLGPLSQSLRELYDAVDGRDHVMTDGSLVLL